MKYFKVTLLLLIFMGCIKFNYSQEKKDNTNHNSCVFGSIAGNNFDAVGYLYYLDPKLKEIPYEFDPDSSFGKVYISRLRINSIGFDGFPGISDRNKCFAVDYHGFFYIDTACEYSLGLSSKGLARLFVDGIIWSEHNDRDSYQNIGDALGVSGGIFLEEGIHEINLQYFHYNNKEIYCSVNFGKTDEKSRIMDLSKFNSSSR